MKIAIITFWNTSNNYGQVLQCFALQRFLKNLGHDAIHIKYVFRPLPLLKHISLLLKETFKGNLFTIIRNKIDRKKSIFYNLHLAQDKEDLHHNRHFDYFREKYIEFTKNEYDFYSLQNNPPIADCYIAGSDQIWSTPSPVYMLEFGPKIAKRIAYAPSLGGIKYQDQNAAEEFKKKLDKLDIVTCREQDGVDVCKRLGRNDTELVPDPVFLLTREDYEKIALKPHEKGYVLIYLLGNPIELDISSIFNWAKSHNLEVKYVAAQGRIDEYPKEYPNVDEFIGLIINAKYVFSNSFHGLAMSIILNKQFLAIPISGELARMNSRIYTILSNYNLSTRLYVGKTFDQIFVGIDYNLINSRLDKQREFINQKFKQWLS